MRRTAVTVLAGLLLIGLTGSPAQAQAKTRKDQVGERGVGATWDLRSVKVQNNAKRFALTVRVDEVRRGRTAVTTAIVLSREATSDPDEVRNYFLSTLPRSKGRWTTELGYIDATSDRTIACRGLRTTVEPGRRGLIRVVFPQRCFDAGRGRMITFASTYDSVVTRELDGMRHAARLAARRGDADVSDETAFDYLAGTGAVTTRRGR